MRLQSSGWSSQLLLAFFSFTTFTHALLSQFERIELQKQPCPRACDTARNETEWFVYHSVDDLAVCDEPLLLSFNIYTKIGDPDTHTTIRACTLGDDESNVNYLADTSYVSPDAEDVKEASSRRSHTNAKRDDEDSICGKGVNATKSTLTYHVKEWRDLEPTLSDNSSADLIEAAKVLKKVLSQDDSLCGEKVTFVYFHGAVIAVYAGSQVDLVQTSAAMLDDVTASIKKDGSSEYRRAFEMCEGFCTAADTFGIVTDASGDLGAVQDIVKSWNDGILLSSKDVNSKSSTAFKSPIWTFKPDNSSSTSRRSLTSLNARADCRTIRVESGDICDSLARRCGIGTTALKSFNRGICDRTLYAGEPVCCSSGSLPNYQPDPNEDGSCVYHEVEKDEGCDMIARSYGLDPDDLFDLNKKTWAWDGCGNLQIGLRICVSSGRPPMPNSVENAMCGPQVPGTKPPGDDEDLAKMNPCPLDVCCNIWGNCGTTVDFCVVSNSSTGNPGTSKPGENGCVDNCGMELVNNDEGPAQYRKVGYFEGWNFDRPCLHMHVNDIKSGYTHIHFAFGEFNSDMQVVIPENTKTQWNAFLRARAGYKKILSFGGWEFSNAPATSGLFRRAVSAANRDTFSTRVVQFAIDNNLDGLDFDWEYPGATDIEGSEPGSEQDGEDYLAFLKLVREKLPNDKSLAIASAASFWYLRGFPIKKMAPVLDYIIHMTYDLHGQWDVGREWSMEGCKAGNCLRSHINSTQTFDSLVMMTKAGVPSHKVVVGVTSYGRSFKMSDSACRGPMCKFPYPNLGFY